MSPDQIVAYRLDQNDRRLTTLEEQLILMRIADAQRKVRAGLWGALTGSVTALATAVIYAVFT